jgi:hypothetical protein
MKNDQEKPTVSSPTCTALLCAEVIAKVENLGYWSKYCLGTAKDGDQVFVSKYNDNQLSLVKGSGYIATYYEHQIESMLNTAWEYIGT